MSLLTLGKTKPGPNAGNSVHHHHHQASQEEYSICRKFELQASQAGSFSNSGRDFCLASLVVVVVVVVVVNPNTGTRSQPFGPSFCCS